MIRRAAEDTLHKIANYYKCVAVIGPRQSGKTTLVRNTFPHLPYANMENPDTRAFATEDPRGFLKTYSGGAILDEIQNTPNIFSYLQQVLDETIEKGRFILTGSNNFLLQASISQSLAGRVGYLYLLPFSQSELGFDSFSLTQSLLNGGYPPIVAEKIPMHSWMSNYVKTYVERDVRMIKNITNYFAFEKLLRLCALRIGQLVNFSSISLELGYDVKTIKSWIGVLEQSFIVFLLQPYHTNLKKRVVKTPKLYFYDTGLASYLLGIKDEDYLEHHPMKGALFENYVLLEWIKRRFNWSEDSKLYFWRDRSGHELDAIIEDHPDHFAVEIKSGSTIQEDYLKNLKYWKELNPNPQKLLLIYNGDDEYQRSDGINIVPFTKMHEYFDKNLNKINYL